MADLIKKIKIKKQDGTFTDYIPIGAEAQNISTADGISVENKLKNILYITDIVDNVTSTNTNKPLSANQGKELKDLIDGKADSSTTLAGYGITDAYTKTESDNNYQPKVLSGTSDPSSSLGNDGDIYLQYSE